MGPAKFGILIVSIVVIFAVLYPLLAFLIELSSDPRLLEIRTSTSLKNEKIIVNLTVVYSGSIPLNKFKVTAFNHSSTINVVKNSTYTISFAVTPSELENKSVIIEFRVADIYPIKITIKR